MKQFVLILLFAPLILFAQSDIEIKYDVKVDTTTGLYGFVDQEGNYVIQPQFEFANAFISDKTAVQKDGLWGIIDTTGAFVVEPLSEASISAVYKDHFLVYGTEKMQFRNISGDIVYEYPFIPGPFEKILNSLNEGIYVSLPDGMLFKRVLQQHSGGCRKTKLFRAYNLLAIEHSWIAGITISYILNNPEEVKVRIQENKDFEAKVANGDIECCGN